MKKISQRETVCRTQCVLRRVVQSGLRITRDMRGFRGKNSEKKKRYHIENVSRAQRMVVMDFIPVVFGVEDGREGGA